MTDAEKKKAWVTRYGSPETRTEVEYEDGDCVACVAAGALDAGQVLFVKVEGPTPATPNDPMSVGTVVRRVEGMGRLLGITGLSCTIVSREDANREIAEFEKLDETRVTRTAAQWRDYVKETARGLFGVFRGLFDPHYMASLGAHYGRLIATHDPCMSCGHGRLLHKRQAHRDPVDRARDEALSESRCRSGHHRGGTPCDCERWQGVETPVPDLGEVAFDEVFSARRSTRPRGGP